MLSIIEIYFKTLYYLIKQETKEHYKKERKMNICFDLNLRLYLQKECYDYMKIYPQGW